MQVKLTITVEVEELDRDGLHDIVHELVDDMKSMFASYDMHATAVEVRSDPAVK